MIGYSARPAEEGDEKLAKKKRRLSEQELRQQEMKELIDSV